MISQNVDIGRGRAILRESKLKDFMKMGQKQFEILFRRLYLDFI